MSDIDRNDNANQMTTPDVNRAPTLGDQIEDFEARYPWGIIAFLGAWAFLLVTYWL